MSKPPITTTFTSKGQAIRATRGDRLLAYAIDMKPSSPRSKWKLFEADGTPAFNTGSAADTTSHLNALRMLVSVADKYEARTSVEPAQNEREVPAAPVDHPEPITPPPSAAVVADRARAQAIIALASPVSASAEASEAIRTGMSVEAFQYVLTARAILEVERIAQDQDHPAD